MSLADQEIADVPERARITGRLSPGRPSGLVESLGVLEDQLQALEELVSRLARATRNLRAESDTAPAASARLIPTVQSDMTRVVDGLADYAIDIARGLQTIIEEIDL